MSEFAFYLWLGAAVVLFILELLTLSFFLLCFSVGAVVAAVCVEEIVRAEWRDLGMPETLWNCRVKEFGPLIVSIDARGRNYFEEKKIEYNRRKDEQIALISARVGFIE